MELNEQARSFHISKAVLLGFILYPSSIITTFNSTTTDRRGCMQSLGAGERVDTELIIVGRLEAKSSRDRIWIVEVVRNNAHLDFAHKCIWVYPANGQNDARFQYRTARSVCGSLLKLNFLF